MRPAKVKRNARQVEEAAEQGRQAVVLPGQLAKQRLEREQARKQQQQQQQRAAKRRRLIVTVQ